MNDDALTQWVRSAAAGDAASQQALWDRFFPSLVQMARRRLQSGQRRIADEEDVALSVLNSFFRGMEENRYPNLRDEQGLWRLLSRMTYRKTIDFLRYSTRKKRQQVGESALATPPELHDRGMAQVADARGNPVLELLFAEECRRLLGLLNQDLQDIALLKLEGYQNQEIARRRTCSVATVERRLKLIREIWKKA